MWTLHSFEVCDLRFPLINMYFVLVEFRDNLPFALKLKPGLH